MNSKEAVNAVLNHRQPDYIPLGTYAIDCDTVRRVIGHETYVRDKIKIQIALWEGRRDEVAQSLKEDSVELFKKLDCIDVIIPFKEARLLPPKGAQPEKVKKLDDTTWESERGDIYKCSYLTNDITVIEKPVEHSIEEFLKEPEYKAPDESRFEAYDYLIAHMKDRFIAGSSGGFEPFMLPGGMENGLVEYCLNPDMMKAMIAYDVKLQNFLDSYYIREGVDQIFIENDFSTTIAPIISPDMFREFILPPMRERISNIKKFRDKVMLHSCGNSWKLMDMIIESGVDCYQSLQTGAGMDMKDLKEKYGDKLCFWGGVAVENLVSGTPGDVRKDVRHAMQYGKPNGGFILGPSHSVAYGIPYDNFMAMLDEYMKLRDM